MVVLLSVFFLSLDYRDVYSLHITKTLVKMSRKHQHKALTELTFLHFNHFQRLDCFYAASTVTGIDSLIGLCLLKVILFILMHK